MTDNPPVVAGLPEGSMGAWNGVDLLFSPHASTSTKLHELAHKTLGHNPGTMSVEEFVDRELDAEMWAREHMDKPVDYRVGRVAVSDLVGLGIPAKRASLVVAYYLLKRGIPVSRAQITWLEMKA